MSEKVIVKKNHGFITFPIDDIVYMEKDCRKIRLYTIEQELEFYGNFSEIEPYLDERFMCCHRSYVINMDFIVWMSGCKIFLEPNKMIYMGRDSYSRARKIFTEYINNKYPQKTLKKPNFFL